MAPNVSDQKAVSFVLQEHLAEHDSRLAHIRWTETPRYLEYIQRKLTIILETSPSIKQGLVYSICGLTFMIGLAIYNCYELDVVSVSNSTTKQPLREHIRGPRLPPEFPLEDGTTHSVSLPTESSRPVSQDPDHPLLPSGLRAGPVSQLRQHNTSLPTPSDAQLQQPAREDFNCAVSISAVCVAALLQSVLLVHVLWTCRHARRARARRAVARRLMHALASGAAAYMPLERARATVETASMDAADQLLADLDRGTEPHAAPVSRYGAINTA